jgi:phenylacetate-CoA ligase
MYPSVVRKVLFPLHEAVMRRPTPALFEEFQRTQWLSQSEIEAIQAQRLAKLLRTAAGQSPWHAERIAASGLHVDARDSVSIEELRRLPTMTRSDAARNRERIAWMDVPGGAHPYTTGGSTGRPLQFFISRQRQAADPANRMRARAWWGIAPGTREVFLWGAPVELKRADRIRTIRDRCFNQLLLNAFAMSPKTMDEYWEAIATFRPECIYGYASSLALLASYAVTRHKSKPAALKLVCTTGEPLYAHQRATISEAFGVPVASEYGSRDCGFTAHESPAGQMVLASESIVLEALDDFGKPVPPGQLGEATITVLFSDAQPFIRYRTGDMVRMSAASCRLGTGLHVIDEVVGRSTDFLVASDGTVMHALAAIYVLRAMEAVAAFKVVQHELRRVEVQVVASPSWDPSGALRIERELQQRMGEDVAIEVRMVDEIIPDPSGKHRYVVSHVDLPDGLGGLESASIALAKEHLPMHDSARTAGLS